VKSPTARGASAKKPVPPFSALLRELRVKRALSQVEVANAAGVSPGYIGLIETGQRGMKPSQEVVTRIGRALGASVEELERLLRCAGWLGPNEPLIPPDRPSTVQIIEADPLLEAGDKMILVSLYQRMVRTHDRRR
jgi:transcriptional regulator with XRE-family HTH domain